MAYIMLVKNNVIQRLVDYSQEGLEKDESDRGWREPFFTLPRGKWLFQQQ